MREPKKTIDQIIDEARAEGKFDDLEGTGKPLVLDTSPDAVIKGLLKNANVVPDWITLSAEIERRIQEADRLLESYAAEYASSRAAIQQQSVPSETTTRASRFGRVTPRIPIRARNATARASRFGRVIRPPRVAATALAALARRLWRNEPAPSRSGAAVDPLTLFHRRWEIALERYAAHLHVTNRKIHRFNQVVPLANRQQRLLPVAERLEAFTDRFPRLIRSADGTLREVRGGVPAALLSPPPDQEETRLGLGLGQAQALHAKMNLGRRPPPIG